MRIFTALILLLTLVVCVGCEEPSATVPATPKTSSAPKPPSAPMPPGSAAEEVAEEEAEEEYESQVAEVGVGKKGRNYGGGMVSEPIRAMFRTEQRLQLMNMDRAMRMYKASNGFLPKTHDIFMKDIIEVNSIELPELPEGERYEYDPEKGELMVLRPKSN